MVDIRRDIHTSYLAITEILQVFIYKFSKKTIDDIN